MRVMETLTKLVVGMSRLGDHLLSRKVSGIIVAALAFGCGAGLAQALKREPQQQVAPADCMPRAAYSAPMQDGVTAWRGTRMLWHVETPPDAELQVVGSKLYVVTKTGDRILVREIKVPKR